mmetsp:Transcript_9042/g.19376  ORF Transcript_9042/g.19376 Transcript_9042/m.19376 type:complete len:362 (-) Transcript_9042:242-1327(-)
MVLSPNNTRSKSVGIAVVAAAGFAACSMADAASGSAFGRRPAVWKSLSRPHHYQEQRTSPTWTAAAVSSNDILTSVLDIRGGAKTRRKAGGRTASLSSLGEKQQKKTATGRKAVGAAAKEKKSAAGDMVQKYKAILPLTRIYLTLVGVVTLMGVILGEELAQGLLALDPIRTLYGMELWRPISAACFFGPPSIGWLMSAYYLFQYGSSLERAYGSAQFLVFIIGQLFLLSGLAILLGQPFFAPSIVTAMLHVLSRSMPKQKVKWLIFNVPYWALPYGLMAGDVLQAQNPMAAIPHIMGILTGHFYFFHKFVWPRMGGEDWLEAPAFLARRMDPNARDDARSSVNEAIRKRKKGKGRKLGGK